MINRIFGISSIGVLLLLTFSPMSAAQGGVCNSPCYTCASAGDLGIGPFNGGNGVPPWAQLLQLNDAFGLGGSFTIFLIRTNGCIAPEQNPCPEKTGPSGSPEAPMGPQQSPGPTIPFGGKPICLASGNTYIHQADLTVPGLGGGITLGRTWNSVWPATQAASAVGMFGPNWRCTYEERVFVGSDYFIKYARSDGSFWSFGLSPTGWRPANPATAAATLVQGNNYWTITFQNGERRQFSLATGFLTAIIDRNGNATQLSYDSSNRLVTVTSPASQHLYFNYGTGSSSLLVTSVTSDFGVSLSYGYDGQGRLTLVTMPDLTTVSFTYNTQSQITAVTDNNGKVLESHTYDSSSRGLTSSQANGVNALTVTYPQ